MVSPAVLFQIIEAGQKLADQTEVRKMTKEEIEQAIYSIPSVRDYARYERFKRRIKEKMKKIFHIN